MYARVVRWEGADGEALRDAAAQMKERAASGPPPGVPAVGFRLLIDPAAGRSLALTFFETAEDMREGHKTLEAATPPTDGFGRRASVEMYEVAVDVSV